MITAGMNEKAGGATNRNDPAGRLKLLESNVGIYGSGQGFEALLLRMRAHPLPEARHYADLMLHELRKVIPSFLSRVDRPERGVAWSRYLEDIRSDVADVAYRMFGAESPEPRPAVTLTDFDADGEDKVLAAACYPYTNLPEDQVLARVRKLGAEEKLAIMRAAVGERANRRHKPGRGFERTSYRFDVLADYGAFRDLQRHRLLTIEWQRLTPRNGYDMPREVADAGCADRFEEAMARSAGLYDALADRFPEQAAYAVALAYRLRYSIQLNARAAIIVGDDELAKGVAQLKDLDSGAQREVALDVLVDALKV